MTPDALEHLESIYRALVKELPYAAGLYVGRAMRISEVNDAILNVWGKDRSVIGKNYRDVLPELEGQPFFRLYDEVYTSGEAYTAKESKVELLRNGILTPFYFNFTYKPLKDDNGHVWAILTTAVDVTELVVTKMNLGLAQEEVRFALDAAELGTWVLNPATEEVFSDNRWKELHGLNKFDNLQYADVLSSLHEGDIPRIKTAVAASLDPKGNGHYDQSFRIWKDGGIRWLRSIGRSYFTGDGICYRFAGTTQDITEEKLYQLEQQKFLTLFESTQDLIGVTDRFGTINYLNKAGQELVGLNGPEEYARPANDYLITKDLAKLRVAMETMQAGGRYSGEIRYRHFKTGEIIPCQVNAFALHDTETGEAIGMACISRDLREEKSRRKDQQKLLTLVENSADMMSVLENDGFNSYINKAGRDLIGLKDQDEVSQTHISKLHRQEDFDFVQQEVLSSIRDLGRWAGKMIIKHNTTDELIPVFNSCMRIDDPLTGEQIAVGAVMRDLRPEIAAQKAITDSEALFRGIATAAPTGLWVCDENLALTFVNQTWIDWTGISLEQNKGQGWLNAIVPEDRATAGAKFVSDFTARQKHESQFRIVNQAGAERWMICTGNPQYATDGTFTGYIGACVDITEIKQLQSQKDEFIGIASHELKTPVTSIKAYAQVLEQLFRNDGDPRKAEMLRKMDNQVNRLTNLITDLLDVSKMQTGKIAYNKSVFPFNAFVEELTGDLQHTTSKHTIILDLDKETAVNADRERIGQVITNFISNAIKYATETSDILVKTTLTPKELIFSVRDHGIGIPKDKHEQVFEQFFRVDTGDHQRIPGLGLGLYISSEIIKRQGGRIWVETPEGKGSCFYFTIPL